jgi:hypothetical protein
MTNLTFDDGEPIDITKLQNLYQLILDVKGEVAKNSIQNQNVTLTPVVYAAKIGGLRITDQVKDFRINYTEAQIPSNVTPIVVVTPTAGVDNVDTTDISYYVTDIRSNEAIIKAKYTGSAKSKATTGGFNYIVVYMRTTVQ